ncbi:MAG: TonB-dependent receptor domain-containing protein [Burkholderiales bacterium]
MSRQLALKVLGALSLALLAAAPLLAQTQFASFTGTIHSKDGNPVPNVEVAATNVATQVKYTARSNNDGIYTITALPIGSYKIRAESQGFQAYETNPIRLETGQKALVDIQMQLGVSESVEVVGVTPILQTQDAVVGEVISEGTIQSLPLNGRNFSQLSLLLPGVITWNPDSFTEPKNFGSGRPMVNGQREQANNYILDGVDMNEVIDNLLPYQPNTDALAEVRVDTNNVSAEYGNVAGAVIGSTIKSGTNEFRGSAFEYWRDSSMAANSWDNNRVVPAAKKADLSQHIFGATLGGPLIKNKLFFFGDFQGFIRDRPGETITSVAPEAWRQGDFSGVGVTLIDPLTGQPFPGNRIPQNRFSSVAQQVLANQTLYPLPNRAGDTSNYVSPSSDKIRTYQGDAKLDWNASSKDRLFLRGSYQHYTSEPERAPLPSQLASIANSPFFGLAANWTRTMSANAVNELLVGYTKVKFETGERTDWAGIGDANASIGIPGNQAIAGLSNFNIGPYGFGSAGIQEFNDIKTYQVTEKYSLFKGRHAFKFGGRWLHSSQGFSYSGNEGVLGHFNYTGAFTGFAFSDFLLDRVAQKGKGGDTAPFTQLQDRIGIFAQDDFKVRNNLTLNIGLSWEYTSPLVEKDDRQINIDLATGQILQAGQNGASRALYDAYYGGFEPRVGFAWTPSEKLVVRGAFGIVQYMEGTGKNLRLPANPPYFTEGQRSFDATTGSGTAAIGFADVVQVGGGPSTLYRIFAPDLRPQFTKQWNLFVERKLTDSLSAQAGYVGSRSSHMVVPFDFNQPNPGSGDPSTWAPLQQRRPLYPLNPDIGTTSGTNSIGVGAYDALQVSLRERSKGGLEFLASYTYGKAMADNVGYYGTGTAIQGWYYLDSTDPLKDYGPAPTDVKHAFSFAANYEVPFGKGRKNGSDWSGLKNAVLGGWDVNTIFMAHSGFPITVWDGAGQSLQSPRTVERPNITCSGETGASGPNDTWMDISCFQHAAAGTFGNSGVGILRGPGYWNMDLGLSKNFYLDDKRYLSFRAEAFNVFNHPNYLIGLGQANMADPGSFGKIQSTASAPRIIELALKLVF